MKPDTVKGLIILSAFLIAVVSLYAEGSIYTDIAMVML